MVGRCNADATMSAFLFYTVRAPRLRRPPQSTRLLEARIHDFTLVITDNQHRVPRTNEFTFVLERGYHILEINALHLGPHFYPDSASFNSCPQH